MGSYRLFLTVRPYQLSLTMMETALAPLTVGCPGCHTAQEAPALHSGAEPLVIACQQCRANIILVPQSTSTGVDPGKTSPHTARTAKSTQTPPRSAVASIAVLSCVVYLLLGMTIYGASYGVKQLEPYKVSESFVRQHPVLKKSFGDPMTFGWFPSLQMHSNGEKSSAEVELRVTGAQQSGQVMVSLDGTSKEWHIREASYRLAGADTQPLWIQFPGDVDLLNQLEAMHVELDQATNRQDVETIMKHIAPNATFRFILEIPPHRTVRTFHNREEFRRETLTDIVMTKRVNWQRDETDFHLAPDGRTATGKLWFTDEVITNGQHLTFIIHETITYSLVGGRPLITSVDGVQQLKK
jgi:hypothetical protein